MSAASPCWLHPWGQARVPALGRLLEEPHDIVDHAIENAGGVAPALDKITTLFSMLVKGYKLTSFILVDQSCSVA